MRLTLEDRVLPQNGNAPEAAAAPVNPRREEFQWLATESGPYAGQTRTEPALRERLGAGSRSGAAFIDSPPSRGELPFGGW